MYGLACFVLFGGPALFPVGRSSLCPSFRPCCCARACSCAAVEGHAEWLRARSERNRPRLCANQLKGNRVETRARSEVPVAAQQQQRQPRRVSPPPTNQHRQVRTPLTSLHGLAVRFPSLCRTPSLGSRLCGRGRGRLALRTALFRLGAPQPAPHLARRPVRQARPSPGDRQPRPCRRGLRRAKLRCAASGLRLPDVTGRWRRDRAAPDHTSGLRDQLAHPPCRKRQGP